MRPSRLAPIVLVAVSLGIAFSGGGAAKAQSESTTTSTSAATATTTSTTAAAAMSGMSMETPSTTTPTTSTTPVTGTRSYVPLNITDQPTSPVGSGRGNYYVPPADQFPNDGHYLFVQGCSTCHGLNGGGSEVAPPLIGVGAAAVDFYVSSGRMPANGPVKQSPRKSPLYTQTQIDALAAYVTSLTPAGVDPGPVKPTVDLSKGDLVEGNLLYANNCAACHNSAGSGGAVGRGYYAPELLNATPVQIAEAIRVGPSAMPVFGHENFTDQQVDSIVKYVNDELKHGKNPGGLRLGSVGPVPEGFFAWIVGLGLLLAVARWIGTRV